MLDIADDRSFLGVASSVTGRRWVQRPMDPRAALAIAQRHDLPEVLGRVLAARNVGIDEAPLFLDPRLRTLMSPPETLRDMTKGARRIACATMENEPVGIIGDYDVDGTCSTAMLSEFLHACGLREVHAHIPHRTEEGYGPSREAMEGFAERGIRLVVTLDCGAMAHDVLAHAAGLGLETVVVDHHQMGDALPPAHAVINPNRPDDEAGQGHLCAAGVAFLLLAAVMRALLDEGWQGERPDLLQWLDLVALATVCDVVPLRGLNRAYVRQGLRVMAKRARPGLAALADAARLKRAPDVYALGFVLGPRINAAGRIGHAREALELLTARDLTTAQRLAARLETMNRERQEIEAELVEQAAAEAQKLLDEAGGGRRPLVVAGEDWHPGVLGLIASRLKERFSVPAVALGIDARRNEAVGSARSVSGVDIGRAVARAVAEGILSRGGGHAMAAGMGLPSDRIEELRTFFETVMAEDLAALPDAPELAIDGALAAGGATAELVELLERAGPFGSGNPSPIFAFPAHRIEWASVVGERHVRCTLRAGDGSRLRAVAFRAVGTELGNLLLDAGTWPLHVAGRLAIDDWNGRHDAQLLIADAARPAS